MQTVDTRNIIPLTDFRNNIKRYMAEMGVSKKPLLLTQHGKSAAVLVDAEEYQKMLDQITFMQSVAEGLEDYRNNRTIPAEVLFASLDTIIAEAESK
jgi:prevent-host-death family protein